MFNLIFSWDIEHVFITDNYPQQYHDLVNLEALECMPIDFTK